VTAHGIPTEIRFVDMVANAAVEAAVNEWVGRLVLVDDSITRCRVTIARPQTERTRSQVRIALFVPGREINVTHECLNDGGWDSCAALDGAFAVAQRQLVVEAEVHGEHARHPA
jgi:hypothetical protein